MRSMHLPARVMLCVCLCAAAARADDARAGVVGVLLRAQRAGDVPGVASLLSRLREEAGFYLRDDFVQRILAETGEVP